MLIAIRENGDIWMDRRRIELRDVRPQMERLHIERPDDTVVIIADKESDAGVVAKVMDEVRLAGITIDVDCGRSGRLGENGGGYPHARIENPDRSHPRRFVHDRRCSGCSGAWSARRSTSATDPRRTRIEFSRMRRDTEVATKRDEKVERERPPPTPETPRMAFSAGGIDNNVAQLTPIVDARGAMSRMTMSAGSDRDVIPLVRINPDYPPRALSRGLEGWVQVQFTITPTGTVTDAVVVNAEPKNIFDDAALKAIARWRYNPKVEGGVAVERVGVQTIIRFQLEQ